MRHHFIDLSCHDMSQYVCIHSIPSSSDILRRPSQWEEQPIGRQLAIVWTISFIREEIESLKRFTADLWTLSNAERCGCDRCHFHPSTHSVDYSNISMGTGVAVTRVSTGVCIVRFDVGNWFAACFTSNGTQVTGGLAIWNTQITVGMVVWGENESNRPLIIVVTHAIGIGKESNFKVSMFVDWAVLHENATEVCHVTATWTWILLIVIVILNHDTVTWNCGIVLWFFWIQTIPHLLPQSDRSIEIDAMEMNGLPWSYPLPSLSRDPSSEYWWTWCRTTRVLTRSYRLHHLFVDRRVSSRYQRTRGSGRPTCQHF